MDKATVPSSFTPELKCVLTFSQFAKTFRKLIWLSSFRQIFLLLSSIICFGKSCSAKCLHWRMAKFHLKLWVQEFPHPQKKLILSRQRLFILVIICPSEMFIILHSIHHNISQRFFFAVSCGDRAVIPRRKVTYTPSLGACSFIKQLALLHTCIILIAWSQFWGQVDQLSEKATILHLAYGMHSLKL